MALIRSTIRLLFLLSLAGKTINALPSGAGNCVGGRAAVGVTHLTGIRVTDGPLKEGGISLTIGGKLLRVGEIARLPLGQDLQWTLNATDSRNPIRGFLLRAEDRSDDAAADTTAAFSAVDRKAQVAETVCINAFNVGGVTHTNNNQKRQVKGIFRMDQAVRELQIDVTVVVKNRNQESIFFYTGFLVSIGDETPGMDDDGMDDNNLIGVEDEEDGSVGFGNDGMPTVDDGPDKEDYLFDPEFGHPLILRAASCTMEAPCGECEGDCNKNSACQDGLECFFRPDTTRIPGCLGDGVAGADYCYKPRNDTLRLRSVDCSEGRPCDKCQGSCESDSDCNSGLSCFLRPDETPVPGCEGNGISGRNYCYEPPQDEDPILALRALQCNRTNPCAQCEGECERHSDCEGDLQCFFRPDLTPVPGCSSSFMGVPGRNYCFQPQESTLMLRETPCSTFMPCNECEGECTHYSQCEGTLECWRRSDMEEVPGCAGGGVSGRDYCYDSNMEDLALTPTAPNPTRLTDPPTPTPTTRSPSDIPTPRPTRRPRPTPDPTAIEQEMGTPPRPVPTESPTKKPTTRSPSEIPTPRPTRRPRPTPEPTVIEEQEMGTLAPSPKPTPRPRPTLEPTTIEQEAATFNWPTPKPTPRPRPTPEPTRILVRETVMPTWAPSPRPTPRPRPVMPTPMPTPPRPTPRPTKRPTLRPTRRPTTARLTADPTTQAPTPKPTQRRRPTARPTPRQTPNEGNDMDLNDENISLMERGTPCSPGSPCGECEGDCQMDDDCQGSLQCFQRPDNTRVPGCRGRGVTGTDYCAVNPANVDTTPQSTPLTTRPIGPTPQPTPQRNNNRPTPGPPDNNENTNGQQRQDLRDKNGGGECSDWNQCGECVGDCDSDSECAGVLRCFFRVGFEQVPGCSGSGTFGKDYCALDPSMGGNPNQGNGGGNNNNNNILNTRNRVCTSDDPCGECQGDCDSNSECAGSLQCFFRVGEERVPGCRGTGVPARDYCAFNPNAGRGKVRRRNQEEVKEAP